MSKPERKRPTPQPPAEEDLPADWRLSSYDYHLPRALIAQEPVPVRHDARLMVLRRNTGEIIHARFRELGHFLAPGDLVVLNDTRVVPARVLGERTTGGKVEVLFLRDIGHGKWEVLIKAGGSPRPGEFISLEDGQLTIRLLRRGEHGFWEISVPAGTDVPTFLEEYGRVPLPPYIHRDRNVQRLPFDRERYQTVYARRPGAVAAPTAGLHFTRTLMEELQRRGMRFAYLTLHVGVGTFAPVHTEDIRQHRMHREYYRLPPETVQAVEETRAAGHRIVAVGTTVCRVLEAASPFVAGEASTDLFIYPPYRFARTDALITNFHLPRSTLLMLVSAFVGRERLLVAYEEAKRHGYRFYSYGDAMLIL